MIKGIWKAALAAVLLSLPLAPASASGDLFYFEAKQGDVFFMLMLVGREDPGAVSVSWKGPSIPPYPNASPLLHRIQPCKAPVLRAST